MMKLMMMMMFEKKKKRKKEKENFDCKIEQPLSKKNALVVVARERSWRRQRKRRRFSTRSEEGAASCILKWCFLPTQLP
tara:strand:+ start:370 stop:606 length:237 start_codon:yes stop_codon:yes gene_type:complete